MTLVRSKHRALSTVVTTAMMLTAVVAIGTGLVAWSNTSVRTYETSLTSSAADKTSKINEMFAIENVAMLPNFRGPGINSMNITVTNTGTEGISIPEIQISD